MKIASLFSGGKDSTFAVHMMQKQGNDVVVLLTLFPHSAESHLLHHSNMSWIKLQSESMQIPWLIAGLSSDETEHELLEMEKLLVIAKEEFDIEGVVHGGIKSNFQKEKFETVCQKLGLKVFTPLWDTEAEKYMNNLLDANFSFIVTSVTSEGLDYTWLGKKITRADLLILKNLSEKFKFNLNFEGGEAETFVVNCPMFSSPITITKYEKNWDGYRGMFEIVDAELNYNA